MSHWYDSTPKKSRRKRDSNPGPSALEADALPLGQRGGLCGYRERCKEQRTGPSDVPQSSSRQKPDECPLLSRLAPEGIEMSELTAEQAGVIPRSCRISVGCTVQYAVQSITDSVSVSQTPSGAFLASTIYKQGQFDLHLSIQPGRGRHLRVSSSTAARGICMSPW